MAMLSGAPRRFLNFCLGAEILGLNMLISSPIRKRKTSKNALVLVKYLSFKDEIQKSPRCPGKQSHEELLAKKSANLTQAFGL